MHVEELSILLYRKR